MRKRTQEKDISNENQLNNYDLSYGEVGLSYGEYLTPHLGIGDMIILKMSEVTNKLTIKQINISKPLIRKYSSNYNTKLEFIHNIISWLYPNAVIELTESKPDYIPYMNKYKYKHLPLYNVVTIPNRTNVDYSESLVFHTKFRYDGMIDKCVKHFFPSMIDFFKKYKTHRKIIIMGEREIGSNYETILTKTISIYNHMLELKNNNDVTDLTQQVLTEGTSFDAFLSDVEIISKCKCNILFGIGGPTIIASAFSKESIFVIPYLNESAFNIAAPKLYKNICEDIQCLEQMLANLNKRIRMRIFNA